MRPQPSATGQQDRLSPSTTCRSVFAAASSSTIRAANPGVSFRHALRLGPGRDQPRPPAADQRPIPPPDRSRVHPERFRRLALRRGPQPDQLHRGQPTTRLVLGIPGEGAQPAVFAVQQALGSILTFITESAGARLRSRDLQVCGQMPLNLRTNRTRDPAWWRTFAR